MQHVPFLDPSFIEDHTSFPELIGVLKSFFCKSNIEVPDRHHHDFTNPKESKDSTLLLMPAWVPGEDLGVKVVTVSPDNGRYNLPSIQGIYLYFDAHKGGLKAIIDAKALTAKRTAAASALAADFLAKKDASTFLMIGTGVLSANLIKAHAAVRPLRSVYVWGRNPKKAEVICQSFADASFEINVITEIEEKISEVDIVSCATLSPSPLVLGRNIREGQHIDLVGSYKRDMREADDALVTKADVFLDTYRGGLRESGDIVIPLQSGVITRSDIKADLFELCAGKKRGRMQANQVTTFKSVGHALEDLAAADYYYHQKFP